MKLRIAFAALFAAVLAAVAAPGAAYAGPDDNEGASVSGVASVAAAPCPSGNVCIYTRQNYTGRMFKLYYCRTYTLSGWNGFGGVQNDNTGDAFARAFDKNGNQIHGWPAGYGHPALNFKPVWYIDPC